MPESNVAQAVAAPAGNGAQVGEAEPVTAEAAEAPAEVPQHSAPTKELHAIIPESERAKPEIIVF